MCKLQLNVFFTFLFVNNIKLLYGSVHIFNDNVFHSLITDGEKNCEIDYCERKVVTVWLRLLT